MEPKSINILSTYSTDTLLDESLRVIRTQQGGPALFLNNTFRSEGITAILESPRTIAVEIMLKQGREYGRIPKSLDQQIVNFSEITAPILVVSTVLDEIDLTNIAGFRGTIFLDIQGYVRDGNNFGQKKQ